MLLVFPSIYALSRSRLAVVFRSAAAGVALTAATCWVLDRLGVLANPLAGLEDAVVAHAWVVAAGLALLAAAASVVGGTRRRAARPTSDGAGATGDQIEVVAPQRT